jgi:hypothetical protein
MPPTPLPLTVARKAQFINKPVTEIKTIALIINTLYPLPLTTRKAKNSNSLGFKKSKK